jgi:hypothetical protein
MTRVIFIVIWYSYSYLLQLKATYLPNMAKTSAAQYEVAAVDDEDGIKWQRRRGRLMKTGSVRRYRRLRQGDGEAKMLVFDTSGGGWRRWEGGGSSDGVGRGGQ